VEKKRFQSPDRDSCIKEFGRDSVKDNPDGSWVCTVRTDSPSEKSKLRRASQMMRGVHREESERGKEVHASVEKERVRFPDGSLREIPGHLIDGTRRKVKGMRGVGRNGLGPTEYFGMNAPKHHQGPDGMWFVWNDGWEPTTLWCRDRELGERQRDPDHNVWVKRDGEWQLEDEVS
jgi:hypothetical protein